jgi:hypothetical protein
MEMARTHVVMSDEVLEAIDRRVGARGRSRFLEEAAREKLDRMGLQQALKETAGVARGDGYSHWGDRRATGDWVRRTRRTEEPS